jgi:hypothetical protein
MHHRTTPPRLPILQPGNGHLTIKEQDLRFFDQSWIRENVMLIGQGVGGDEGKEIKTSANNKRMLTFLQFELTQAL